MTKTATAPPKRLVELPKEIRDAWDMANIRLSDSLRHSVDCGRLLCEAKEMVPHGEWQDWLRQNVEFCVGTANRYMRLFKHVPELRRKGISFEDTSARHALDILTDPKPNYDDDDHPDEPFDDDFTAPDDEPEKKPAPAPMPASNRETPPAAAPAPSLPAPSEQLAGIEPAAVADAEVIAEMVTGANQRIEQAISHLVNQGGAVLSSSVKRRLAKLLGIQKAIPAVAERLRKL